MKIAIIGLGLIGGSWGLALKQWRKISQVQGNKLDIEIIGFEAKGSQRSEAEKKQVVDRMVMSPMEAVREADIVLICTPVMAVRETFEDIAREVKHGAIVSDVASTKRDVMRWAKQILPTTIHFIGGHPMAGKTASIEEAEANLFKGCTYCLCASTTASEDAIDTMTALVENIGAKPHYIDPEEHDTYVAAISHMPFIASVGLVNMAAESDGWRELCQLASTGFQDTTRLAGGNAQMWLDICRTNNDAIIGWIERYQQNLDKLKQMLQAGGLHDERGRLKPEVIETEEGQAAQQLRKYLEKASENRELMQFTRSKAMQESSEGMMIPDKETLRQEYTRMFVGGLFSKRKRDEKDKR